MIVLSFLRLQLEQCTFLYLGFTAILTCTISVERTCVMVPLEQLFQFQSDPKVETFFSDILVDIGCQQSLKFIVVAS